MITYYDSNFKESFMLLQRSVLFAFIFILSAALWSQRVYADMGRVSAPTGSTQGCSNNCSVAQDIVKLSVQK
jgi:hypothetical protein